MVSKIPISFSSNSSAHMASLIGERFSLVEMTNPAAMRSKAGTSEFLEKQGEGINHIAYRVENLIGLSMKKKQVDQALYACPLFPKKMPSAPGK